MRKRAPKHVRTRPRHWWWWLLLALALALVLAGRVFSLRAWDRRGHSLPRAGAAPRP